MKYRTILLAETTKVFFDDLTNYKKTYEVLKNNALEKYKAWTSRAECVGFGDFFDPVVAEDQARLESLEDWVVGQGGFDKALVCAHLPPAFKKQLELGRKRFMRWVNVSYPGVDEMTSMRTCKGWLEAATSDYFVYTSFDKFGIAMAKARSETVRPGTSEGQDAAEQLITVKIAELKASAET